MDYVSSESAVHQPTILTTAPELSADELVCEIEYDQARAAWLADPGDADVRAAGQASAAKLAAARARRRTDG